MGPNGPFNWGKNNPKVMAKTPPMFWKEFPPGSKPPELGNQEKTGDPAFPISFLSGNLGKWALGFP